MIDRGCGLSLSRQCGLLGVSRSSQYHEPQGESAENLALMRRLDELHLEHPFYGSRQMARHLRREGVVAGRHRVRRLMRLMGMEAVYRRRYLDNVFIERLWRSLKYEAVYLHEIADGRDAERVIGSWFRFYAESRPHSSLGGRTPGEVYRGGWGEVSGGRFRSSRAPNQSEYTLIPPSDCPTNQDHLTRTLPRSPTGDRNATCVQTSSGLKATSWLDRPDWWVDADALRPGTTDMPVVGTTWRSTARSPLAGAEHPGIPSFIASPRAGGTTDVYRASSHAFAEAVDAAGDLDRMWYRGSKAEVAFLDALERFLAAEIGRNDAGSVMPTAVAPRRAAPGARLGPCRPPPGSGHPLRGSGGRPRRRWRRWSGPTSPGSS